MNSSLRISLAFSSVLIVTLLMSQSLVLSHAGYVPIWTKLNPTTPPGKTAQLGMARSTADNNIYIFGGYTGTVRTNQFMMFDTTTKEWSSVADTGRPNGIDGLAMDYDPVTNQILMFGGKYSSTTWNKDLHVFNFSNNTWTSITRTTQPSDRINVRMVYDSVNKIHLLYGGYTSGSTVNQELWSLNTSTFTWQLLSATNLPGINYQPNLVYVPTLGATMLFGGRSGATTYYDYTYLYFYANSTWKLLSPTTSPTARSNAGIGYDSDSNSVVVYGGSAASGFLSDTWVFNCNTFEWSQLVTNTVTQKQGNRISYSPTTHSFISFGGYNTVDGYFSGTEELTLDVSTSTTTTTITNTTTSTETTTDTTTQTTTLTNFSNITNLINSTDNVTVPASFFVTILPVTMLSIVAVYRSRHE